jgi:F0F1-type ATP synthase alpha subunit
VAWESQFIKYMDSAYSDLMNAIMAEKRLSDDSIARLRPAIDAFNRTWSN